jgi:hypothetical protein
VKFKKKCLILDLFLGKNAFFMSLYSEAHTPAFLFEIGKRETVGFFLLNAFFVKLVM